MRTRKIHEYEAKFVRQENNDEITLLILMVIVAKKSGSRIQVSCSQIKKIIYSTTK